MIIAYSSILHMSLLFISYYLLGNKGYLISIYSHCFISSLLFKLSGILYLNFNSYSLFYLFSFFNPFFLFFLLLIFILNSGLPFSLSFLSEYFILLDLYSFNPFLFLFFLFLFLPFFLFNFKLFYNLHSILPLSFSFSDLLFFIYFLFPFFLFHLFPFPSSSISLPSLSLF